MTTLEEIKQRDAEYRHKTADDIRRSPRALLAESVLDRRWLLARVEALSTALREALGNVGVLTEQLTTASVKLGQEHTRAEAAEATLARVRELVRVWEGSDSDIYKPNAAIELREALTTLTVAPAPRVNERQQLEYMVKLAERYELREISAEDYHAAVKEIFGITKENS